MPLDAGKPRAAADPGHGPRSLFSRSSGPWPGPLSFHVRRRAADRQVDPPYAVFIATELKDSMNFSAEGRHPSIDERFIPLLRHVLPRIDATEPREPYGPWLVQWVSERAITDDAIALTESLIRQERSRMNRTFAITALQSKLEREARYLNKSLVTAGCWRAGKLHLIDIDPIDTVIVFSQASPAPRPLSGLTIDGDA